MQLIYAHTCDWVSGTHVDMAYGENGAPGVADLTCIWDRSAGSSVPGPNGI